MCTDCFFSNTVIKHIYDVINDLEVGTSYKIDAVKLANHFFGLKMATADWTRYPVVDKASVCAGVDVYSAVAPIINAVI